MIILYCLLYQDCCYIFGQDSPHETYQNLSKQLLKKVFKQKRKKIYLLLIQQYHIQYFLFLLIIFLSCHFTKSISFICKYLNQSSSKEYTDVTSIIRRRVLIKSGLGQILIRPSYRMYSQDQFLL
ncbi:unnamed protein product [Paramecium sonneborni]|uniref:Transmembrane protein n=1 Tax=Paramecium sonneborni TaxID=65129 RepID=A0A8S1JYA9_9CILI|nr:unnamed protein product [Paramecium sonneborni]